MPEMLQMSLKRIEFYRDEERRGTFARVTYTLSASTIAESEIIYIVPTNGNLGDLQRDVDKLIRDLVATLAQHQSSSPATASPPRARPRK